MTDRPFVDRPATDVALTDRVASVAADMWGLPRPELLRRGMNVLYRCGDTVLRLGHTTAAPKLGQDLVVGLAAEGIPVVPPVEGLAGMIEGLGVSAWEYVPAPTAHESSTVDWSAIGAAVCEVHALPAGAIPVGYPVPSPTVFPWWDFDAMLAELAPEIDARALSGITTTVERYSDWRDLASANVVICHGDVHPGNVLDTADGPRLVDWDLMCSAPPAWDHAMLTTFASRWGGDESVYPAFADGYGKSLADDDPTIALGELRNVAATLMRVRAGLVDNAAAVEAERRLRYWRGDPDAPTWRAS